VPGNIRVHRDFFRNGYWRWNWQSPKDDSGYAVGTLELPIRLPDLPEGSTVTSFAVTLIFSNWSVQNAGWSYGNNLPGGPGKPGARTPECLGIGCRAAEIQRFESPADFAATRTILNGEIHNLATGTQSGSLDLLSVYSSDALDDGGIFALVSTVRYNLGRPFFGTEGRNANTEFDVNGRADVDLSMHLRITYDVAESPLPPAETPEPSSMSLIVIGGSLMLPVVTRFARNRNR
jgi:hypothetical protein